MILNALTTEETINIMSSVFDQLHAYKVGYNGSGLALKLDSRSM